MDISDRLPPNLNPIFDPPFYKEAIQIAYNPHIEVLHEMMDWGVQIFRRTYSSFERDAANLMILTVLYKQALVSYDAAVVCLEEGAINAAMMHARGIIESRLYLEWVLKSDRDSQYLGRQLYVANKRQEIHILKRKIPGTEEYDIHKKSWISCRGSYNEPSEENVIQNKDRIAKINTLLQNEIYRDINESFDTLIAKRGLKHEPYWYSAGKYGVSNLFQMAEELKRLPEFVDQYYYMSLYSHGSVSFVHATFVSNKEHQVEPIRTIENFDGVLQLLYHNIMFCIDMIVREYREGELVDFSRHADKWIKIIEALPEIDMNIKPNYLI